MSKPTTEQLKSIFADFEKKGINIPVGTRGSVRPLDDGPPDGFPVHFFFWGFNIYISGANITWLGNLIAGGAAGVAALAGIISGIPGLNLIGWALAGYIVAEIVVINGMNDANGGRGVYISMTWIAPGIFVPTPA